MRVERVTAYAFGPLVDETLELAPGLTVVHGPNESAKSTWHAAIQAAICGRGPGRGKLSDDARFAERYRPWDRDAWEVGAELVLDDGRRVELRHDLDARADSRATDLVLGTDVTSEIINERAPDASVWLGLGRAAFAATASVRQADLLDVRDRAGALQEHIQRAAATGGADETAAAALAAIDAFRGEHVGLDRQNSVRPLRRAIDARAAAGTAVAAARAARAEHERRLVEIESLRVDAAGHDRVVALHDAAAAIDMAQRLRGRADEAAALDAALGGAEPSRGDDAVAGRVAAALAAWRARPPAPDESDEPSAEATSTMALAGSADTMAPAGRAPTDAELFALAARLDAGATTPPDPRLEARLAAARDADLRVRRDRRQARRAATLAGVLVIVAGALAWLSGAVAASVAAALAAVAGATAIHRARRRPGIAAELAAAEQRRADDERQRRDVLDQRRLTEARCAELGVPADPDLLREWARQIASGARVRPYRQATQRIRADAASVVLAAAAECGLTAADADEAAEGLAGWQRERDARAGEYDRAHRDWARRTALLDGRSLTDLLAEAADAENRATKTADGFTEEELGTVARTDEEWRRELHAAAREVNAKAVAAQGSLDERAKALPSLAEAEEELARAEAEEARVRELDAVLGRTRLFLADAQERVHRDIAPRLAASVRRSLPAVTGGRYTDAIVDPQSLAVRVRGPQSRLRQAHLLSHGTAEQIYLLLRIALAEHLTRPGTRCPLLLDDVTVHADSVRMQRILELLLRAAGERQIVLFTQQEQVRDWARRYASAPPHALVELPPVTV